MTTLIDVIKIGYWSFLSPRTWSVVWAWPLAPSTSAATSHPAQQQEQTASIGTMKTDGRSAEQPQQALPTPHTSVESPGIRPPQAAYPTSKEPAKEQRSSTQGHRAGWRIPLEIGKEAMPTNASSNSFFYFKSRSAR